MSNNFNFAPQSHDKYRLDFRLRGIPEVQGMQFITPTYDIKYDEPFESQQSPAVESLIGDVHGTIGVLTIGEDIQIPAIARISIENDVTRFSTERLHGSRTEFLVVDMRNVPIRPPQYSPAKIGPFRYDRIAKGDFTETGVGRPAIFALVDTNKLVGKNGRVGEEPFVAISSDNNRPTSIRPDRYFAGQPIVGHDMLPIETGIRMTIDQRGRMTIQQTSDMVAKVKIFTAQSSNTESTESRLIVRIDDMRSSGITDEKIKRSLLQELHPERPDGGNRAAVQFVTSYFMKDQEFLK